MNQKKKENLKDKQTAQTAQTCDEEKKIEEQNVANEDLKTPVENVDDEESKADKEAEPSSEDPIKKELDAAQAEAADWKDKYIRLSAEFDNYRKRTMKEKAELILNGSEKTILSVLPIVDNLERALKTMDSAKDVSAVKDGVDLIYKEFINVLDHSGVKAIETKDKDLNTDFHEAIAMIPAPNEDQKGKILDCVQTGYMLNEKVIRHAKVVVGQ
jgi:molecular chaperone GrpE